MRSNPVVGSRPASRGFTLIEALVALVVLSIGLLGVAAMQLKALQSAHAGYQRALVSLMAIDAQERAWAMMSQSSSKDCSVSGGFMDWEADWSSVVDFNYSVGVVGSNPCEYEVEISWLDHRFAEEGQNVFSYRFRLPVL